jgi:prepilin-type N-terminal cleavage/methylation domain-containing protein
MVIERFRRRRCPGFTLIELLAVVAIIAVLIGITLPAIGRARDTSRRVKCLANLRGMGQGLALYLNQSKQLFPYVRPLHDPGSGNEPSLLEVLADFVDAEIPRKGDDGRFVVADPFKCPSDLVGTDAKTGYEPLHQTDGTSYDYYTGKLMILAELNPAWAGKPTSAYQKAVSKAVEERRLPIIADYEAWHQITSGNTGKNATIYPDFSGDWFVEPSDQIKTQFWEDVAVMLGK